MENDNFQERIKQGRDFVKKTGFLSAREEYPSDQQKKIPRPELTKPPMTEQAIALPMDFEQLAIDSDFLHIINSRKSHRVYTEEPMSLLELSYLLWCAQGVKSVRGKATAAFRTVPSGGARHPFECYLLIRKVDGLECGLYHYLPFKHQIEYLGCPDDPQQFLSQSVLFQDWACKANVIFYFSCVFYRAEWRYGVFAHAPLLIDSGHITQNLYLAATSIGHGGCAIAAVNTDVINQQLCLDGEEESAFYAMAVGTVRAKDADAEEPYYKFVLAETEEES